VPAAWTSGWKAGNPSACARLARSGRGHRPCQSVPLPLFQPGGQSPRPAPAPPPARASPPPGRAQPGAQSPRPAPAPPLAGASRPPGRALAFCCSRTCRSTGHRAARAGETRVAFPDPAQRGNPCPRTAKTFPAGSRSDCCFGTLPVVARFLDFRPLNTLCRTWVVQPVFQPVGCLRPSFTCRRRQGFVVPVYGTDHFLPAVTALPIARPHGMAGMLAAC